MKEKLIEAIKSNAEKAVSCVNPDAACKYTQAALNAAHALAMIVNLGK